MEKKKFLFLENFFACRKSPRLRKKILWKIILFVENVLDQVNFFLWKFPLTVENFLVCKQFLWLKKNSLINENFLDCGIILLFKKSFLDCGKRTFLTSKEILSLIILKTNASVETIKTYILSLGQKHAETYFACLFCSR